MCVSVVFKQKFETNLQQQYYFHLSLLALFFSLHDQWRIQV